jgi:putative acetyltransferase
MDALLPFTLRPANNQDAPAIYQLISDILRVYGIATNRETIAVDLVDVQAYYFDQGGALFVLLDGQVLIGTVAIHPYDEHCCELGRMYLRPGYRRRGLGRALLETATREARQRGFQRLRLATASVLTEAIALYTRAGFLPVTCSAPGGNCDLVMVKELREGTEI